MWPVFQRHDAGSMQMLAMDAFTSWERAAIAAQARKARKSQPRDALLGRPLPTRGLGVPGWWGANLHQQMANQPPGSLPSVVHSRNWNQYDRDLP